MVAKKVPAVAFDMLQASPCAMQGQAGRRCILAAQHLVWESPGLARPARHGPKKGPKEEGLNTIWLLPLAQSSALNLVAAGSSSSSVLRVSTARQHLLLPREPIESCQALCFGDHSK
jgi:hypothetical protein